MPSCGRRPDRADLYHGLAIVPAVDRLTRAEVILAEWALARAVIDMPTK